ncbi:MAG TPA: hypothetical protein VFV93_06840 [Thermomicrobiales bacterium]|nr:hypothetical protein [Thermomicrobiales bacterium]
MRWLMALLAFVLLSACSASSESGDSAPQRSAADLATVRAQAGIEPPTPTMRPPSPTPTTPRPTATARTQQRNTGYATDESLYVALMSPDDISPMWTLGNDEGIGLVELCGAAAIEDEFEPVGWAYGSYSASGGEWAEQWVIHLLEPDARAAMDYARASLTCDEETFAIGSGGNDSILWEYSTLNLPEAGDDLYALGVTMTYSNPVYTPMNGSIVFVRQGEYVVVLLHYGFGIDLSVSAQMAQVAVARLDMIQDSSV